MAAAPPSDPDLEQVTWDLSPLLDGTGGENGDAAAAVDAMLSGAKDRAAAFAEAHRGKVASLDASGLAAAMHELEQIEDMVGRAYTYAALCFSTNTADPARGALLQKVQEDATAIGTQLVFWELEWAALDDARAAE